MSDLPPPSTPAKGSPVISTPCPTPLFPSAFSRLSQPRTVAKQLEEASVGELPPNPTIEDLPKVVWKNRRFVQEDSLARKGAKGRKSWIRSHGMFFIELNHQDQPIGHVWCCSRCDTKGRPEFFSVQATSSAADHLRKAHRITPASQSNPSDDSAIDLQSHATPKRPRLDQSIIPKAKVKAVQELSVGFVIDSDVPFTIFEHKFLKELFYQFDHELALQIPWSRSSITRELQKIFESKADIIKAELGSALTKIHISFDLWTSPNRCSLYLRRQLGIHSGENLAETLFEIVQLWDIRGQVGTVISDNVTTNDTCLSYFYRQLDPSIRPADIKARRMRCYGHVLNLVARAFLFGKDAESFELESDINGMRGLQEQDLRHWRSKSPIGKLHNIGKFIRSSPQRSEYFKRIAHEQEDEGYHLCEESTAELEVILNNETRWNSTYMMIERALRKQTDIRAYIFALEGEKDEEKRIPADDILSNEDWRVLGEVNEILTPLYHQTMRTQGWGKGDSHGRLWEVLVGMEYLLEHFEDWKGFYNEFTTETIRATNLNDPELIGRASAPLRGTNIRPARSRRRPARFDGEEVYVSQQRSQAPTFTIAALPEHSQAEYAALDKPPASKISQKSSLPADHRAYIRASINNGWKKLDEYYSKLGESPLFAAAIILHPRFGISWLEATWATEEQLAWVRDAKAGIKDYFARWYQSNQRTDDLQSKSASSLTNRGKEDDHYTQWINSRTKKAFATSSSVSEMDKYLRLEPQDTQEPIQWWRDHKPSFPVLSSFALDVFAIPAMATDCERQFSLAKLTLTSQRLAMGADTLERVHCLRNWVRHGGAVEVLDRRGDELREYLMTETGSDYTSSSWNVQLGKECLLDTASRITGVEGSIPTLQDPTTGALVVKEPYGVVLAIAPWNGPYILGFRSVTWPIAAGNTVVLKGSELSPKSLWAVASVMQEAGLPDGVLNYITSSRENGVSVTKTLIESPEIKKLNFTGSSAVGRIIAQLAGANLKPALMELGGKAPAIVCEDADLDVAAKQCVIGAIMNSGQICMSTERILVHKSIRAALEDKLKQTLDAMFPRDGDALVLATDIAVDKNKTLVRDAVSKGAKLLHGDVDAAETTSSRLRPIIVSDVKPGMDIYATESFGPTVSIIEFDSEEEAIRIANDTEYGLTSAIFSKDLRRALRLARQIETGAVHINRTSVHDEAVLPHGGVKASGFGRFNRSLEEWVRTKNITYDL
ncbi:Vanillin dehydrogenase [Fusarium oxysporum f. sp. conglutinans]|nr:Vanillin dehydrogenase [Fusarium oxysporum f. sp. conglutinans]